MLQILNWRCALHISQYTTNTTIYFNIKHHGFFFKDSLKRRPALFGVKIWCSPFEHYRHKNTQGFGFEENLFFSNRSIDRNKVLASVEINVQSFHFTMTILSLCLPTWCQFNAFLKHRIVFMRGIPLHDLDGTRCSLIMTYKETGMSGNLIGCSVYNTT